MADLATATTEYGPGDGAFSEAHISVQAPDGYTELDPWQQREVRLWEMGHITDHRKRARGPRVRILPGGVIAKGFTGVGGAPATRRAKRGEIYGLSAGATRRLRELLMSVEWGTVDGSWINLTWHHGWGNDPAEWKKVLRRVMVKVERTFPATMLGYFWRLEFQKRGAPHFHIILCWKKGHRPQESWLATWLGGLWVKASGNLSDRAHRRYGCKVVDIEQRKGKGLGALLGYLACEVTKGAQNRRVDPFTGEVLATGRLWGLRGDVPRALGTVVELSECAWSEFCDRVQALGVEVGSKFLQKIHAGWAGFRLIIGPDALGALLAGLGPPVGVM